MMANSSKRRLALFIVNTNFYSFDGRESVSKRRLAAGKDYENLQLVFSKTLGFEMLGGRPLSNVRLRKSGERKHNISWEESPFWEHEETELNCACISCQIRLTDFTNCECFILAISSHGTRDLKDKYMEQGILLSDENCLPLRSILDLLRVATCKAPNSVPCVLLLDVCRTDQDYPKCGEHLKVDQGQELKLEGPDISQHSKISTMHEKSDSAGSKQPEKTGKTEVDLDYVFEFPEEVIQNLPENFLIAFSCYINKKSYLDRDEGCWMTAELKNAVENHKFEEEKELSLLRLLTEVTRRVANREGRKGQKQAVTIYHRLLQPVHFTQHRSEVPAPALVTSRSAH